MILMKVILIRNACNIKLHCNKVNTLPDKDCYQETLMPVYVGKSGDLVG